MQGPKSDACFIDNIPRKVKEEPSEIASAKGEGEPLLSKKSDSTTFCPAPFPYKKTRLQELPYKEII